MKPALAILLWCSAAHAGFCTSPQPGDTRHEFQLLAGYSPGATTGWGSTTNRQFLLAGFQYRYRCWTWERWSLGYTGALLPVAVMHQPERAVTTGSVSRQIPARTVYGGAVIPFGLSVDAWRRRRAHPFAEGQAGVVASVGPIPQEGVAATGLNFVVQFGGGMRWKVSARNAVTFGYKFMHISNGYTSGYNPGLDNHVIYAGYSWLK